MKPLRAFVRENRVTVAPEEMRELVCHHSIPALDLGGPELVESTTIDSHKTRLAGGELLISRLNPRKPRVHLVDPGLEHESVASTEFVALHVVAGDPRFLRYLMLSEGVRQDLDSKVRSATRSHQRVDPVEIMATEVAVVHADEQRRIADFLDDRVARIDQIIAARQEQIEAAEQRFVAARRHLVLGLDGPTKSSPLPWATVVGKNRRIRRLTQLARMGTGHTPSRSEADYWVNCDIPWLTTSDVHKFRRDEIDWLDSTAVEISALGLSNSAAVLHPAGTVALSRTASAGFSIVMQRDMATSQDFATWTCGDSLLPDFLLQSLRVMRPYLLGYLSMGSTHKTIYFPDLMDIRLPVPPLEAQRAAADAVKSLAASRASLSAAVFQQLGLLQEYKQSLITAAVTGELDVTTAGSGIPT